jgi:hypothetical protein
MPFGIDTAVLQLGYTGLLEGVASAGTEVAVRDEIRGTLRYTYPLGLFWRAWQQAEGYYFRSTPAVGLFQNARWRLLGGFLYARPRWEVGGGIGWETLQQFVRQDDGVSARLTGTWHGGVALPVVFSGSGDATFYRQQRQWYDAQLALVWHTPQGDTLFRGGYRFLRQDLPLLESPAQLQQRREYTASGELALEEHLFAGLRGELRARAMHMTVSTTGSTPDLFPIRRTRFSGGLAPAVDWKTPLGRVILGAELQYTEENNRILATGASGLQEQRQREEMRDFNSLWTQLRGTLQLGITARDSLELTTTAALLRYDTPSPQNTDDRDEQQLGALLSYRRLWRREVVTSLTVEFQGRHTVFLLAPRSAWNHWLYTLSLRWGGRWSSGNFSWSPLWEVLASYSVRDYPFTTVLQDLSWRQWSYRDSLSIQLGRQWGAELQLAFRQTSVGILDWSHFAELPRSNRQEYGGGFLLTQHSSTVRWACGMRFSGYRSVEYEGTIVQHYRGIGPQARLELSTPWGRVVAEGWYELRRFHAGQRWQTFPWLTLQLLRP